MNSIGAVAALLLIGAYVQAYLSDDIVGSPSIWDDNDLEENVDLDDYAIRMNGGSEVTGTNFTYELLIKPNRSSFANDSVLQPPYCSGVLIGSSTNGYYALTTASCALAGDIMEIFAGTLRSDNTSATNMTVNASVVIAHEDFLRDYQTADIALIPLGTNGSIVPDGDEITVATLPSISSSTNSFLWKRVLMAGWGYPTDVYKKNAQVLREVKSTVVPVWYCALLHPGLTITSQHICTNGFFNKGPCTGDAGSPLVIRSGTYIGNVVGLATHVPRNGCQKGKPGIFTRVTSYLDWIVTYTKLDLD